MDNEYYMKLALELAREAFNDMETPIGCVIADADGNVIGRGRNRVATEGNSLCHAEIIAINEACFKTLDWRLTGATLFVTVEPCPMCAGAIVMSRITNVVFGAKNPKAGCAGSIYNLLNDPRFNHRASVISGVLSEECGALMTRFFRSRLSASNN